MEGDILERLNELGVRSVPSLVMHGDAPDPAEIFYRLGLCVPCSRANLLNGFHTGFIQVSDSISLRLVSSRSKLGDA